MAEHESTQVSDEVDPDVAERAGSAEDRDVEDRGVEDRGVEDRDVEDRDVEDRDVEDRDVEAHDSARHHGSHEAPDGAPLHPLIDLARDPHPGEPDHALPDRD